MDDLAHTSSDTILYTELHCTNGHIQINTCDRIPVVLNRMSYRKQFVGLGSMEQFVDGYMEEP